MRAEFTRIGTRKLLATALLAALAAGAALAGCSREQTAADLALTHATVFDPALEAPIIDATVLIAEGRITAVAPSDQIDVPSGAEVMDLRGKFIMPGLIDSHVHLGLVDGLAQNISNYTRENVEQQLRTYAAYGVTSVQVMGTDTDLIHEIAPPLREGPSERARVWTAGRGVVFEGSYGGVAGLEQSVATPEQVRAMVDREVGKGANLIKFWIDDEFGAIAERMPYTISQAVIEAAHARGKKAVAHVFYLDNARELARQDVDAFVHQVRDAPLDEATLQLMQDNAVAQLASTLSREASFTYDVLPFVDEPFFTRGVSPAVVEELKSDERRARLRANPNFARYPGVLETALGNFGRQARAGVAYGMGTDSGPSGRFGGYFAHWELELMVRAGVTPREALTAATMSNASLLGATDIGRVAPGYQADLLVLDADPLADIRNTRAIHAVFIGGRSVATIWETCVDRPEGGCEAEQP